MKRLFALTLLALGTGCHGPGFLPGPDACPLYPPPGLCAPPPAQPCPPPQQVQPPARQEAPPPRQARTTEVRETVTQSNVGAVAQDVILVPRTVYVPYAPQVPVAPVRVARSTLQTITGERRETVTEREAVAEERGAARSEALNAELLRTLRSLNERLERLEQSERFRAPPPPRCDPPPGPPVPCPK